MKSINVEGGFFFVEGGIWVKYFLGVVVLVECKKDKPYDPSLKVLEPILDDLQLFS
jgi:hypothetical protein